MQKIGLWLCLLPLLLSGCQYSKRIPKTTILSGEVIHRTSQTPSAVRIWFTDPVFKATQVCMLDSAGGFEAQANILIAQNHLLQYGDEFIQFYAVPGDSIHITIDAARFNRHHDGITFSGDHQAFNQAFDRCVRHMDSLIRPLDTRALNVPIDTLCVHLRKDIQRLKDSLHSYAQVQSLPKELVRHMEIDLTYRVADLYDAYKRGDSTLTARQERYQMYQSAPFEPDNAKLFESIHYPIYLTHYSQALIEASLPESVLRGPRIDYLTAAAKLIAAKEESTLCRDHMLYHLIWSQRNEPGLESVLPNLTFLFTNAYIADYLSAQVRQARNLGSNPPERTPLQSLTYLDRSRHPQKLANEDFFDHLRATYPEKVIYINLYMATDDSCRRELLQSGPLHRPYIGKEVVFVNLCVDSEYNTWQPTVRRLGIEGENYFVNMAESEAVRRIYHTWETPAFLLMDRQGQVIADQVAPPSQREKAIRQIDECLQATPAKSDSEQ